MNLHTKITKALTGTTPKHPVLLDTLRKIAAPLVDDMQQLYGLLDQLYACSAIQRVSGYKDGKQYVAYWEIENAGNRLQNQFLASRITTLPASALKVQASAPPAAAPAKSTRTEYTPMPRKSKPGSIATTLLDYITKHPGKDRAHLINWAVTHIVGADRAKANSALGNLGTRKQIESTGERFELKYYAKGAAPEAETPATPEPNKAKQSGKKIPLSETAHQPSADQAAATSAAEQAALLIKHLRALHDTKHPLVQEITKDLLETATPMSRKLHRLADHLKQLATQ